MALVSTGMVDSLAQQLGDRIGATVTVIREGVPNAHPAVKRYRVHIAREGFDFTSGNMKISAVKQWLALLDDWINLGFIRLEKNDA